MLKNKSVINFFKTNDLIGLNREFVFALFLVSGQIKTLMTIFSIQLPNITLLLSVFLVLILLNDLLNNNLAFNKITLKILSFHIFLFALMLFSLFYTYSDTYSYVKTFLYILIILSAVFPLLSKQFNVELLLQYFMLIVFLMTIAYVYIYPKILAHELVLGDFESVAFGIYQIFAYLSGLSLIILIILKDLFKKIISLPLMIWFVFVISISGARGAVVFTVLILSIYILFNLSKFKNQIFYFILTFFVLLSAYNTLNSNSNSDILIVNMLKHSTERINLLFADDHGNSIDDRIRMIVYVENEFGKDLKNIIFGYGIGSFGIKYYGVDVRAHPHNILLEYLFELGILGFITFSIYILYIIFMYIKHNSPLLILPVLYLLFNALKSSSFVEERLLVGLASVFLVMSIQKIRGVK